MALLAQLDGVAKLTPCSQSRLFRCHPRSLEFLLRLSAVKLHLFIQFAAKAFPAKQHAQPADQSGKTHVSLLCSRWPQATMLLRVTQRVKPPPGRQKLPQARVEDWPRTPASAAKLLQSKTSFDCWVPRHITGF